jgi:hypothetical protein
MQKMEVTNFRNFSLKNSGISGLGKRRNSGNPEIGISRIAITNSKGGIGKGKGERIPK